MELTIFLAVLIILVFIGVGIFLIVTGLKAGKSSGKNSAWPSVSGKVLSSEVVESSGFDNNGNMVAEFKPVIRFVYQVMGKELTSIQIGPSVGQEKAATARQMADRYPVGARVTIHYDPQKPTEIVLPPRPEVTRSAIIAGGVVLLIGLLGACAGMVAFLIYFFTH